MLSKRSLLTLLILISAALVAATPVRDDREWATLAKASSVLADPAKFAYPGGIGELIFWQISLSASPVALGVWKLVLVLAGAWFWTRLAPPRSWLGCWLWILVLVVSCRWFMATTALYGWVLLPLVARSASRKSLFGVLGLLVAWYFLDVSVVGGLAITVVLRRLPEHSGSRRRLVGDVLAAAVIGAGCYFQPLYLPILFAYCGSVLIREISQPSEANRYDRLRFASNLVLYLLLLPILAAGWLDFGRESARSIATDFDPTYAAIRHAVATLPEEEVVETNFPAALTVVRFPEVVKGKRVHQPPRSVVTHALYEPLNPRPEETWLVADLDMERFTKQFRTLAASPAFALDRVAGRAALFRPAEKVDPATQSEFAEWNQPVPPVEIVTPHWSDPWTLAKSPRILGRDQALVALLAADVEQRKSIDRNATLAQAHWVATAVGAAPLSGGYLEGVPRVALQLSQRLASGPGAAPDPLAFFAINQYPDVDPRMLIGAIRSARRGVAAHPRSPQAWQTLGDVYAKLFYTNWGRSVGKRLPLVDRIWKVQILTAYHEALKWNADSAVLHNRLARFYFREMNYRDFALDHLQRQLILLERSGPSVGDDPERWDATLTTLRGEVDEFAAALAEQNRLLDRDSANLKVIDQARQAAARGLAKRALERLLASDIAAFGPAGMALEFDLLLTSGRADEAKRWLEADAESALGGPQFAYVQLQIAATLGDRDLRASALDRLRPGDERLRAAGDFGVVLLDATTPMGKFLGEMQLSRFLMQAREAATYQRQNRQLALAGVIFAWEQDDRPAARRLLSSWLGEVRDDLDDPNFTWAKSWLAPYLLGKGFDVPRGVSP